MPNKTKLKAIFSGKVKVNIPSEEKMNSGGGVNLTITSGKKMAIYMHLDNSQESKDLLRSIDGKNVIKGEIIAFSGNTGNTTGPHLDLRIMEELTNNMANSLKALFKLKTNEGMYVMEGNKPVLYRDPEIFMPQNKDKKD